VVFAIGTPISNTMAEMFTVQRYLQIGTLRRNGLRSATAGAVERGALRFAAVTEIRASGARCRQSSGGARRGAGAKGRPQ